MVGLALAGAISAGAYTAGVLDFLIEALDSWEDAKKKAKDGGTKVPVHNVVLCAISGTSAGGICAPLLAAALVHNDKPKLDAKSKTVAYLPRLYNAWVTRTRLFGKNSSVMSFTSDEDLRESDGTKETDFASRPTRKQKRVKSLLNGALLDEIAKQALLRGATEPSPRAPRPYISNNLHLFLMTGNLRGVPYGLKFAQQKTHGMLLHADRIHATVENLGGSGECSIWAGQEKQGIRLDALALADGEKLDAQWELIRIAALATCAFPAGLPSRIVREAGKDKEERVWPMKPGYQKGTPAYPDFVPDWPGHKTPANYSYVSADGGIANNEPFEYARFAIMMDPPGDNNRKEATADRAVIMVDPFPEPPAFSLERPDDDSLVGTVGSLFGALIDQGRFKYIELVEAQKEKDAASRFLVAPSRADASAAPADGKISAGANAIATGLAGGFGGFIEEEFRAHDYQLGRRNCQQFLRDHFALPRGNPLFDADPDDLKFDTPTGGSTPGRYRPIIPLIGDAVEPEITEPDWPFIAKNNVDDLMIAAERRLDRVVPALLKDEIDSRLTTGAGTLAWKLFLKGAVLERIRASVVQDLIKRNQYKETLALSPVERRVLAIMYGDTGTQLTKYGISRRYFEQITSQGGGALDLISIQAMLTGPLAKFIAALGVRNARDLNGKAVKAEAYQVREFAPGFLGRITGAFDSPPVD